ncbi:hypothetical protein A5893_03065 [Pedobacter psychrophilus]|uniref:VRR-NUC domain-containing protein n=1 Tax=Pedobacter psychrophilus TaxID=1826909 RepID=A0A179DMZ1_9SPHI|nr:hypothetical protein [Pedobacter psychrophilus]OAQ42110.1 hypothetical protein A5893_03065 [Pedobacter psychrophilus]
MTKRYSAPPAVVWLRNITNQKTLEDRTSQGITKCVMLYVNHIGGFCSEIDNRGFFNKELNRFVPSKIKNGFPDVVACLSGRFIGIEVKSGKDTMRQAQYEICIEIEQAKGRYFIAKDFQGFYEWIQVLKKGANNGK